MVDWKKLQTVWVIFVLTGQLIACARPDTLTAVSTEAPAIATQPLPVPTATQTSLPTQEPALPPAFSTEMLPVTPPNFETVEERAEILFDLTAAHAVYAYYRQEVGPLYNLPEANFIQEMSQYYTTTLEPNGIHLVQSMGDSAAYALLTRGSEFFAYFTPDGVLADYIPGHWNKTDKGQWVEAGGTNGPLELFIGEDGLAYIAQLGTNDGIVYRFFNPIGATVENLDNQWIPVEDCQSTLAWSNEEKKWVNLQKSTNNWNQEAYIELGQVELKNVDGLFTLVEPEKGKLVIEGFDNPENMGWTQTKDGKWVIYDTGSKIAIETISKDELKRLNILPGLEAKRYANLYDARGFLVGFETRMVLLDPNDMDGATALFGVFKFYDPISGNGKGVLMENYVVGGDMNKIAYAEDFDQNVIMGATEALSRFQLGSLISVNLRVHSSSVESMNDKGFVALKSLGWNQETIEAMYYFYLNRPTMVEDALDKINNGGIVEVGHSLQINEFRSP